MEVTFLKPFYTNIVGNNLRIVFAYQYLSINKGGKVFHFIPMEDKEIIIDIRTRQVTNLKDVFVFQEEHNFIRLPLYQFLLISNVNDLLSEIIDSAERKQTNNHKVAEALKPLVKIIRKVDIERQYRHMLALEQDYELASLSQALKDNDNTEIIRSKNRLKEIHHDLESMAEYS
ncbi:transcriptional regulator [Lysinibacillus sp. NPDC059133]|uniref:transcriptional regulator n=1 Tax=Lysinibacillus sp. NPDC059133 TaxID=3346737 RepID=UPI0036CFE31B